MYVADYVYINGEVLTVDKDFSVRDAVAVKNNKILAVGRTDEILRYVGDDTVHIDLKGRSLLPGFIDSHAHLELYGTNLLGVDCKHVTSISEIKERLREKARKTQIGDWVRGWGYNQNVLEEGRHLTRWDLDEVSTEHPIIVVRTCGHISAVNSRALELAGIDQQTPDPDGGKYVRENEFLTGVLLEAAHMNMFLKAQFSKEEITEALRLASIDFARKGITSVHDAGGYDNDHFRHLFEASEKGDLMQRVYVMYGSLHDSSGVLEKGLAAGIKTGMGDEKFKIGPAKVFIDGSSSGPTSATREPYTSNPSDSGILYLTEEDLIETLGAAHKQGWQITAHAVGDKAVEMIIQTIETLQEKNQRNNCRHRIEHSTITPPDLIERLQKLDIVTIPNPSFVYEFGDGYVKDYGERVEDIFPAGSFLKAKITAAIGSDSPITTFNPLVGIHTAVNRCSKTGNEIGTSQRITVEEAIKLYTWNGAYASFEEDIKGSIEIGKLADLVVLDRSILKSPVEHIKDIDIDMTMLDGKVIFQK